MSGDYFDLLIAADGIALDEFGLPLFVEGRASIAQDIKHMIRESGYLVQMIAERNAQRVKRFMILIEDLVENDLRIQPGTAEFQRLDNDTFLLTAKTIKYGDLELSL
jgi:hypothetical protein